MITDDSQDDFKIRTIDIEGKRITILLPDCPSQQFEDPSNVPGLYKHVDGIILLFDVCNRGSLSHLQLFYPDIDRRAKENTPLLLLGNKCDKVMDRQIATSAAAEFADGMELRYGEVSALLGTNVELEFISFVRRVYLLLIKNLLL